MSQQSELKFRLLDRNDSDDLYFMFTTRSHPKIDSKLEGSPPSSYEQHKEYISKKHGETHLFFILEGALRVGYSQIYNVTSESLEVGFAVSPDFQGKGFGKRLVRETLTKCSELYPEIKQVRLIVKADNERAVALYLKTGFRVDHQSNNVVTMFKGNE